jgi:ABC-type dipeptide/oligopeptide/nickel transport system permease component
VKAWWVRPAVRLAAAFVLPLAVPAVLTLLIWALPGDPAEIICPPERCGGSAELAARWNLDQGPWHYYVSWVRNALSGEFGNSWRVQQGVPISELLAESVPVTAILFVAGMLPVLVGALGAALGWLPRRADGVLQGIGLMPAVIVSLLCAAFVELSFGAQSYTDPDALRLRLGLGAVVLGLADGAMAGAAAGVRALFRSERRQRYVQVALLRGESVMRNMMPNVTPALAGQLRGRALHLLSGLVVVEVVLRIDGVGDLLWRGTLLQDFGMVLATASLFATASAGLLLLQAMTEIVTAMVVRGAPRMPAEAA